MILELAEYEAVEVELSAEAANKLHETFAERVEVRPAGAGKWSIKATQYVGTLRCGEVTIHIRPKVGLRNLLALLDVEVSSEIWRKETVALEKEPDLLTVMARLYCIAIEDLSRRGIQRSYVVREERLVAPRGRIDLVEAIRSPGIVSPIACRFDEHTADTPLNQLLKRALEVARRIPAVSPTWQRRLLRQLAEFEGVSSGSPDISWTDRWEPPPMERHYVTAVRLAALLIQSSALHTGAGDVSANSFLLNMNLLFERWVGRRLQELLPVNVVEQHTTSFGQAGEVEMNPDLTFWSGSRVLAVADCKYKLAATGLGRSSDYYQALAYATVLGLSESWLLYARFPDAPTMRGVAVRNSPVSVRTFAVDLTGPIGTAVAQLSDFGDQVLSGSLASSAAR